MLDRWIEVVISTDFFIFQWSIVSYAVVAATKFVAATSCLLTDNYSALWRDRNAEGIPTLCRRESSVDVP